MKTFILYFLFLFTALFVTGQNSNIVSPDGDKKINTVSILKGQNPVEFVDFNHLANKYDVLHTGMSPEGDFMQRSVFSTDGNKVFTVNGYTANITVYDFETMETTVIDGLSGYPVDIAVTDDYAVVACISGMIYVIDLSNYSIAADFEYNGSGQACVVVTSPDENFAYVGYTVSNQVAKVNLQTLEIDQTFIDIPINLLSYSWSSTGGRSSFIFSRFEISHDGEYLIVGNGENSVLFIDTESGELQNQIDIPSCYVTGLSGDGSKTIAVSFSYDSGILKVYQIDNSSHSIINSVEVTGYQLSTYDVAVNNDGSKAYIGISDNKSALIRFETSDFLTYSTNYTPFWLGTGPNHRYVVHGQYNFAIFDFETESFTDKISGHSQLLGAVSPVDLKVIGYDPLRYEGAYFFDCNNPSDIVYKGKSLSGQLPEGDVPYRIALREDGEIAVTVDNLSESISIINTWLGVVDTSLSLGGQGMDVALTNDGHWAITGGYDDNRIKIVDLENQQVVKKIVTGQRPMMVTLSPDDQYAYIGNLKSNSVSIIKLDGANSELIKTIPVGVIGVSYAALGVRSGIEIDPTGQYLLVAASFDDKVQIIDVVQKEIVAEIAVGDFPIQIAFNDNGEYAVVTNLFDDTYSVIHVDGANSTLIGTYNSGGTKPLRLDYNEFNNTFYIINYESKNLVEVSAETWDIISSQDYSQYGNPIQVIASSMGVPIILTSGNQNTMGYLICDGYIENLPDTPSFFDYTGDIKETAVICMPGYDFVSVILHDPDNIHEQVNNIRLSAYPNPVQDKINIDWENYNGNSINVAVLTMEGKTVLSTVLFNKTNQLDINNLKSGIYVLKVSAGNKSSVTKFVKN